MAETQGRGPYEDDGRIERPPKYAPENGGTSAAKQAAAKKAAIKAIQDKTRGKTGRLFGK